MDALYDLKEMLCEELEEYGRKEKMDVGSLEVVDKLAHTIKNLDKIIEKYEDSGYSEDMYNDGTLEGGKYSRRMRPYSMARGRTGNVRRDSMGRYSKDTKMMVHELRELMEDAPDERTKMEFKKFIEKVEHM